jgi:hypothetical protein
MKYFVAILLASVVGVESQAGSTPMLVADFEAGRPVTTSGRLCLPFTDKVVKGTSTIKLRIVADGANGTKHAAEISGQITTDFPYGFAGLDIPLIGKPQQIVDLSQQREVADISQYQGIRFYVKGDNRTYQILFLTTGIKDYDYFGQTFLAPPKWTRVEVRFSKLRQMGFGRPAEWTGKDVQAIRFQLQTYGPPIASYRLAIDQVEFF